MSSSSSQSTSAPTHRYLTLDTYEEAGRQLHRLYPGDDQALVDYARSFTNDLPSDSAVPIPDPSEAKLIQRLQQAFATMDTVKHQLDISHLKLLLLFGAQMNWPGDYLAKVCKRDPYPDRPNYPSFDGVKPVPNDFIPKDIPENFAVILATCLWTLASLSWPVDKTLNQHMELAVKRFFQAQSFKLLYFLVVEDKKVIFPLPRGALPSSSSPSS